MRTTDQVMTLEATAVALGAAGYAAYTLTIVGHAAPIADRYRERVTHPEPGDLVVETSTFAARSRKGFGHVAVGTLVRSGVEHIVESPTDEEPDGFEYDELAWYVRPFVGGDTVRWTNAEFIAIPRSQEQVRQWEKRR
jgi:hypothetical protein